MLRTVNCPRAHGDEERISKCKETDWSPASISATRDWLGIIEADVRAAGALKINLAIYRSGMLAPF